MTTREEAAATAIARVETGTPGPIPNDIDFIHARAALAAADAHDAANGVHRIDLGDEAVERAARTLAPVSDFVWERLHPLNRLQYVNQARAVIAALKEASL